MFGEASRALQVEAGSWANYARREASSPGDRDALTDRELDFPGARNSIYLASVTAEGWSSVQHPGGRAGFIQSLGDNRIGFGDYPGNRAELAAMYDPVHLDPSVTIEFPPSPMRDGSPLRPFICTMPGDARLEFATTDG